MSNYVINTIGYNKRARIFCSESTELIVKLQKELQCSPKLKHAYLEFVSAMSVMAGPLVDYDQLYIKFTGDHPTPQMTGIVDATGNIRGYIKESFTTFSDKKVFGKHGVVFVRQDTGHFNGYTGVVDMSYSSVAKNLENYFRKSEQLPTYIRLFVLFDASGNTVLSRGIMLQLLPGESTSIFKDFNRVIMKNLKLFHNPDVRIDADLLGNLLNADSSYMSQKSIQYQCNCAKEQYYGILFSLSSSEIDDIIKNKQQLEATCSICGKTYYFPHNEVAKLFGIY